MDELILIVDDEPNYQLVISEMLTAEGYAVLTAGSGEEAFKLFEAHPEMDLVLTDMTMPNGNGIELLEKVKEARPEVPVIMLTAHGTVELAVKAMKQGAFDYLTKPYKNDELTRTVAKALEVARLGRQNKELKKELIKRHSFGSLIGKSKSMLDLYQLLEKVAPTRSNVLITGESGTGKELVARAIHYNSPRKANSFVVVNCSALSPFLLESELFGHERGSFTGAEATRPGRFELAHGGTLFLDEIGEISQSAQVKLLRALQERYVERVGGSKPIPVDARLVAATNRDLKSEVAEGRFREDLFYRLNVVHIPLPPLREKLDDLPLLIDHFLAKHGEAKGAATKLAPETKRLLYAHNWPGNVRELENVIERGLVLATGNIIFPEDLPSELRKDPAVKGAAPTKPQARKNPPLPEADGAGARLGPGAGRGFGWGKRENGSEGASRETAAAPAPNAPDSADPGPVAPENWTEAILREIPVGDQPLSQLLLTLEEGLLRRAMEKYRGAQSEAADELKIRRNVFKYKWDKFSGSYPSPLTEKLASFVPEGLSVAACLDLLEEAVLRVALWKFDWVQAKAAECLGLRRNHFLYKLRKYPELLAQAERERLMAPRG
ncbi:MAG: sigma 54-interacting transcriptional regulator [Deltaproteobacteria bacterium]|jgi:two-component system NtrC family response regulator|nr:sigma 54-interacting transcriptional regulator [Deltaproteobacteria bacterium]